MNRLDHRRPIGSAIELRSLSLAVNNFLTSSWAILACSAAVTASMTCASANAAELRLYGYEGATNTTLTENSAFGPIDIERERVQDYFANNRVYRNVARFTAYADYGINKVTGAGSAQAFNVSTGAISTWTDNLVVRSAVSNGFIRAIIDIASDLDATPSLASAQSSYRLYTAGSSYNGITFDDRSRLNSGGYDFFTSGASNVQHITTGPYSRRIVTLMIPYNSGQSFFISSSLQCSTSAFTESLSSCDAGHSTYWGGIHDVTDAQGNSLANWTVTSESGTNYRQSFVPTAPVPEPATWAMLIAGFGAVGGAMRRRVRVAARPDQACSGDA